LCSELKADETAERLRDAKSVLSSAATHGGPARPAAVHDPDPNLREQGVQVPLRYSPRSPADCPAT